jgi:hypothetical protein
LNEGPNQNNHGIASATLGVNARQPQVRIILLCAMATLFKLNSDLSDCASLSTMTEHSTISKAAIWRSTFVDYLTSDKSHDTWELLNGTVIDIYSHITSTSSSEVSTP